MLLVICVAAALLSSVLVRAMIRVAVLDMPGHRSSHDRPVPKGGGVGVIGAFLAGVAVTAWLHGGDRPVATASLLAAAALLASVSWLDDLRQFPPLVKLSAQAAAAGLLLWGIGPLPGPWLPALASAFVWLLFVTNALNFIDGLNGLAAGSMALACLFIGVTTTHGLERTAACMLAAGLIGFLPFNYPRARIFLGDVGSQGAGLVVAGLGLLRWQDPAPWSVLVAPLLLSGILYDVGFTLCRRLLAGERLLQAHRGHLYQVASRSGVPPAGVALLHWGFVLWGAALALALSRGTLSALAAAFLVLLPQLAWTGLVIRIAHRRPPGRW